MASVNDLSAFVLAGGRSSRMGSDKAFLEINGQTLLARALQLATSVTDDAYIVGSRDKFQPLGATVEDIYSDRGPLGGIHAALSATKRELNLVLAVDLPFIEPKFLDSLVHLAKKDDAVVTVPRAAGGLQPLCAVYRTEFRPVAEQALQAGRNKIDPLFQHVSVR